MGLLEGYYIPHYLWHYSPKNFEERVHQFGVGGWVEGGVRGVGGGGISDGNSVDKRIN